MDILKQFDGKINGTLETFDRVIINGYIQPLQYYRLFLYYLIQKNVLLKDFDSFAKQQTDTLCSHIDSYIQENNAPLTYLTSGLTDKGELARQFFRDCPGKIGLVCAFSVVEPCRTITVKPNHESKKLEVTSRTTKCKHYYFYCYSSAFRLNPRFLHRLKNSRCTHKYLFQIFYQSHFSSFQCLDDCQDRAVHLIPALFPEAACHFLPVLPFP